MKNDKADYWNRVAPGAVFTHFTDAHIAELFSDSTRTRHQTFTTATMHGNPVTAFRSLYQRKRHPPGQQG